MPTAENPRVSHFTPLARWCILAIAALTFLLSGATGDITHTSNPSSFPPPDVDESGKVLNLVNSTLLAQASGVQRVPPRGWKLTPSFQGISTPKINASMWLRKFRGDFTFHFTGILSSGSQAILLLVTRPNKKLPFLEVTVDAVNNSLGLRYLGTRSFQRVSFDDVFSKGKWSELELSVHGREAFVSVDCNNTGALTLRQKVGALPEDAEIRFGGKLPEQNGMEGVLLTSTLLSRPRSPSTCNDQKDIVADDPFSNGKEFDKSSAEAMERRLMQLEEQFLKLSLVVEDLQKQKIHLTSRIVQLETCECVPRCNHKGTVFREGELWALDNCTQCQCMNNKPKCEHRYDLPNCEGPCLSSPCLNNGECFNENTELAVSTFRCDCPPPYDGRTCEIRQNPCIWPAEPGPCEEKLLRYYYDKMSQQCLPFIFSGCGGNVNNYHNLEECINITLRGACCYRNFKTSIQDVKDDTQELKFQCQELHIQDCKAWHRSLSETESETEVISFNPGLSCQEATCNTASMCVVGQQEYREGETLRLGCQTCTCMPQGKLNCICERLTVRKEIRDMTPGELARFQNAVAVLRRSQERTWEQFRDLYMYHVMQASAGAYFLPWHRTFLRHMEQRLQEVDCDIVLPYFDFTTDVGFFEEAVIWQPNFFGGNSNGACVLEHPFGIKNIWQPCFVRNFNTSIQLPTQAELLLALAEDDYLEMSFHLETYVAYVHNFIGGDMMTMSSPYDPVFYTIHAYIDMLYWTWQKKGHNKNKFPAAFGNIPMIPFNIPPGAVFDSEAHLCVTYTLPSKGSPCTITSNELSKSTPSIKRSDLNPETIYVVDNPDLLRRERHDFDVNELGKIGFNRDGYDQLGYDIGGYNRYGFNTSGYDRYGYNSSGLDRDGRVDTTGRFGTDGYDVNCLNRQGLTREGLDQYGFYTNGLDKSGCGYYFRGPFAPLHTYKIFSVLKEQSKDFLMSLARTCVGLDPVPAYWLEINWASNTKDVNFHLLHCPSPAVVPVQLPEMQTGESSRFCFDTQPFLTSCTCDLDMAKCQVNPCINATCLSFPEASCRVSFCGECFAKWYHRDKEVNCEGTRDYCDPNPCQNGGSCHPSIWINEPQLFTCNCIPGYDGDLCQYKVLDPCILPLSTGSCESRETRWYYNQRTGHCETFVYLGCGGNGNSFPNILECQDQCVKGSCCSRQPKFPSLLIGFDNQGYDKYGFNAEGYNITGAQRTIDNSFATGRLRFDEDGFDWQGFDRDGYGSRDGLNRANYNKEGYDKDGFNITGYSKFGEYDGNIDYDEEGYDAEGFNRAGLTCHGNNRLGFDIYGVGGEYTYNCAVTTMSKCQELARDGHEIIRFTRGKTCEESGCGAPCGCHHGNQTYTIYQQFKLGCQTCSCTEKGVIHCVCDFVVKRKEIREMSGGEMNRYQKVIRRLLQETGHPSEWYKFASLYSSHKPQAVGNPMFLPWNRQYIRYVEQALQNIDCGVAIPYYDWTIDAGKPKKSLIWAANIMGGNGGDDGCVQYHPFKSYHPPYLSPCLRRRFNSSVSLPSLVNIELALREPSYDRFRLQVEMFARLYQSFVGGHLASDFAPYDPLFYSVMAFIDKLWFDWQDLHTEGLLGFPLSVRYAKMDPFKSVPDDIFDSQIQLCVDYVPLTEGAPCNVSDIVMHGYNSLGYDRHGYNRQGYDKDAYNISGFDISGNLDLRGIYNKYGFNREGFSRTGFDSMGIDQFGFFNDSFNLDNFDASGYDRTGYNRYGFNRQMYTPYGYNAGGSYHPDVNVANLRIFDSFGYNRYGYNANGFDRNGYDIFGFTSNGYDNRICNSYFNGPFHVLVKQRVATTLSSLNTSALSGISRICPQVTPLPEHIVYQDWFDRQGQRSILYDVYQYQVYTHRVDDVYTPRQTSITADFIWLPLAPDERLCIVTEVYTNCPLGENHILCSNELCDGRVCPGHPTAVCRVRSCGECSREWYEGITGAILHCSGCIDRGGVERREEETWMDGPCHSCVCLDGEIACQIEECPQERCSDPILSPDQCCPSCNGCSREGLVVMSGSDFKDPNDHCSTCHCDRGNVTCSKQVCPDLGDCQNVIKPKGQCCLECLDCGIYVQGDRWKPDPCRDCTCQAGNVICTNTTCPATDCEFPYKRPGHCCAECSRCLHRDIFYNDGEMFKPSPCQTCTCRQGSVVCSRQECPAVTCENPVTPPGQCCRACHLDCEYEGKIYKDVSTFNPMYNPCLNCSCTNSIVRCRSVRCEAVDLPCTFPVRRLGECCPSICTSCEDQGVEHQTGETWPSHNSPCDICECQSGKVICKPHQRCPVQCSHGVFRPGECCSQCTECLIEGRVVSDGETVTFSGDDTCRICTCHSGNLNCRNFLTDQECPKLNCSRTEVKSRECCPTCAGCIYKDKKFKDGETVTQDSCVRCACKEGEVICDNASSRCPPAPCRDPKRVEGQCCPVCNTCVFYGQDYKEGDTFISPLDPCQNCLCQAGIVTCTTIEDACPVVTCSHPARRRDQCCKRCDACLYERKLVRNGQRFTGVDKCKTCVCKDGSVFCTQTECPLLKCSKPTRMPGHCCPVCESVCVVEGKEYLDGEVFPLTGDECTTCTCESSEVKCKAVECEHPDCSHPATLRGECCPKCNFCLFEHRIFRNQQRFVHPRDLCQQCACDFGSVTCVNSKCESLFCSNPVREPGSCCPVCPKQCAYGGLTYDDGGTFINPNDKCEDCLCRQGQVHCKRRGCPKVECANPVQDGCCPVCSDCTFGILLLIDGETVPDPNDNCQICKCEVGSVKCHSVSCPAVSCTNPIQDGCCPSCAGCDYRGNGYKNNSVIDDADRCRTCVCQSGNVKCVANPCPPVTCEHPHFGQCCDECTNCLYNGVLYKDGQKFPDPHSDSCQDCTCFKGNVVCTKRICPAVSCTHPVQRECCTECKNCLFHGQLVNEGTIVPNPKDSCEECQCRQGNVNCRRKQCPSERKCHNPVVRGCCKECLDCTYNGQEYRSGERFMDPASNCIICGCAYGEVVCQQRTCPQVTCSHPVQGECCLECTMCYYNSRNYYSGHRFTHSADRCQDCECQDGNVTCSQRVCPSPNSCTHPVSILGECCPVCGQDCLYQGQVIENGNSFQHHCQDCQCVGGSVHCSPKQCPQADCPNPVIENCCPKCIECSLDGIRYRDGQVFSDLKDACLQCTCLHGSVDCNRRLCKNVDCSHPSRGQCCPECDACNFAGHTFFNGQRFLNPSDSCYDCVCQNGNVTCLKKHCSPVSCRNPVTDNCDCPVCTGCNYQGGQIANGLSFQSSDACENCICSNGTVTCQKRLCGASCIHPASVQHCCPQCDHCLYNGQFRINGQMFVPQGDPCKKCQCQFGSVTCQSLPCPPVSCPKPVKKEGDCCPSCPVCQYLGKTYRDNERFPHPEDLCQACTCKSSMVDCESRRCIVTCSHPRPDTCCPSCDSCYYQDVLYKNGARFYPDPCRSCTCDNGNVVCEKTSCPTLSCVETKRPEGQCCEVCTGCTFKGVLYRENEYWESPDDKCTTCTCQLGLVTCRNIPCNNPCGNNTHLPGQCCHNCRTCNYDGADYLDGEEWTSNDDPCQQCLCEDGRRKCSRKSCPNVVNCPSGSLRDPEPGSCCPSCVESFASECSREELGKVIHPLPNDPCFICECQQNYMWECTKEVCPTLLCPTNFQVHFRNQCCPKCQACYDPSSAQYYKEGAEWTHVRDPCKMCTCKNSRLTCSTKQCQPAVCSSYEMALLLEDNCCETCQSMPSSSCFYERKIYQTGSNWTADECTSCRCNSGYVTCHVRSCSTVQCVRDESLVTVPGQCCPVCKKRPGTCIVYGDLHYKTFDNSSLHIQGTCRSIMSSDCKNDLFRVEVHHASLGLSQRTSSVQNITVYIAGSIIDLLQGRDVKVNNQIEKLPFLYEPHFLIEKFSTFVLLSTEIGLRILWDGINYAELTAPASFHGNLCGLCGNFNGIPQDDLMPQTRTVLDHTMSLCTEVRDRDPCLLKGFMSRKNATMKCLKLKSNGFRRCHREVPPEPFFTSCIHDLCVCQDDPNCLCRILEVYARECAKSGVKVAWRSSSFCDFECDSSKGLEFDECVSPCPRTCANIQTSGHNLKCLKPCVPSCQCPSGKVLHNGTCIFISSCPHIEMIPVL